MMKQDIDQLYAIIKRHHEENVISGDHIDPQHKSLLPQLRPYQKSAVQWMTHREKIQNVEENAENVLHPLFTKVQSKDGQTLYYNRKGGFLAREFPHASGFPTGGILADEMGLGKTVEVLSCMLCNPRLDVPQPEPLEVINIYKETRKRRRRRSVSPTEFNIYEHEGETLDENTGDLSREPAETNMMQVIYSFDVSCCKGPIRKILAYLKALDMRI